MKPNSVSALFWFTGMEYASILCPEVHDHVDIAIIVHIFKGIMVLPGLSGEVFGAEAYRGGINGSGIEFIRGEDGHRDNPITF